MQAVTHPVLSAAEFAALQDRAGWTARMELILGEVVAMAPSGGAAALAQTELVHRLRAWQSDGPGLVLTDVFVRIGDAFLAPDVAWWSPGREPAIAEGALTIVPDLVAEVLSPATRGNDLGPKREQYLGAGVKELWLVDPAAREVVTITRSSTHVATGPDELTSDVLPGLAVPVAALFA